MKKIAKRAGMIYNLLLMSEALGHIDPKEAAAAQYPHIVADIVAAPALTIAGRDGKPYHVVCYSFSEFGATLRPQLIREITGGLVAKTQATEQPFAKVVGLEPAGDPWGFAVANRLRMTQITGWVVKENHPAYQIRFQDEFRIAVDGPFGRQLCFRGIKAGDRVVVVDDVISTGATARGVLEGLRLHGIEVVGFFVIVTKGDGYKKVAQSTSIPIHSLVHLAADGKTFLS